MDLERFTTLADAYGGDLRRWPETEQAPARALLTADARAAEVLARASAIDALLNDWRIAPASIPLRDRVWASAPLERRIGLIIDQVRLWLAGAGLAAAVCGVSCGVFLSQVAGREARDEALIAAAYRDNASPIAAFSEPVRSL